MKKLSKKNFVFLYTANSCLKSMAITQLFERICYLGEEHYVYDFAVECIRWVLDNFSS